MCKRERERERAIDGVRQRVSVCERERERESNRRSETE